MKKPELFASRTINKGWYGGFALEYMVKHAKQLETILKLEVDGKDVALPIGTASLIILNLASYMGGTDLWNVGRASQKYTTPSISDGKLEIVGVTGVFHMGRIQAKISSGKRIAQGSSIKIITTDAISAQVDGEPWKQAPCTVTINHLNVVNMLKKASKKKPFETAVPNVKEKELKDLASNNNPPQLRSSEAEDDDDPEVFDTHNTHNTTPASTV